MKITRIVAIACIFLSHLSFTSCNKDCYNPSLEAEYKNKSCTTDCPGVKGCDGKTYCNECEANRVGVAVKN